MAKKKQSASRVAGPEKELARYRSKNRELEDMLKRLQADFENYKKQVEKKKAELCRYASCEMILKLLPLLDSFENALKNSKDGAQDIMVLYKQLYDILSKEGLRPIEAVGKKLDPFRHDVLMQESDPKLEDEIITEELLRGYMLNDRVLRHSKVKVNKVKR